MIEPADPSVLPQPGGGDLQERLRRFDEILNRTPERAPERLLRTPDRRREGAEAPAPRPAPAAPVTTGPESPLMEVPRGLAGDPGDARRAREARDAAEILRRSRESEGVMAERARRSAERPEPSAAPTPAPTDRSHIMTRPADGITARDEPTSRMIDRIAGLTGRPYPEDDIHGLPVRRPPVGGRTVPPRDIETVEVADPRRDRTVRDLNKLARFFRGDQEEEAGMRPPEPDVVAEPLPRVIDNMVPENDPARGRVVDDSLLDLTGVERTPDPNGVDGGGGRSNLDPNFVDRLSSVLGPVERQPPPSGDGALSGDGLGLSDLEVPDGQIVPPPKPDIPDPWTMTVEKTGPGGESRTLGVSAVSPEDGSELRAEQGPVETMVTRIRQLLGGPGEAAQASRSAAELDEMERQQAAERLLSEALRDGAPAALPDQGQWPVTEVETANAPPGVPPAPRPGVLSRTSLEDVVLSLGESVTLENTLPPQQDGIDPLNSCVKKNRGTTLFCIEPVDWPTELREAFVVPTILYTGPMAITRYDQGTPSRLHALFSAEEFEDVVAYYQARYGEPTEIWKRSIAPLAQPRMDNPTVTWRSRDSRTNVVTVLEIRKFDDTRGGFPDTSRGAAMLYHLDAPAIFPQVSSHELMRLRRTR